MFKHNHNLFIPTMFIHGSCINFKKIRNLHGVVCSDTYKGHNYKRSEILMSF